MDDNKITQDAFPLTDSQFGIYLECIDETNCSNYLIPLAFSFPKGSVEPEKLAKAFDTVAKAYSAFSTVITTKNSEPIMTSYNGELPKIQIFEISDSEVKKNKDELFYAFTFDGKLLWRAKIFVTETKVILFMVVHHNIFDGSSMLVFNKALSMAYAEEEVLEGKTMKEAQLNEAKILESETEKEALEYYRDYLDGIENDSNVIPDKAQGKTRFSPKASLYNACLKEEDILPFAKENGITENIVFLCAFSYALSKFNNQKDVVFSSAESGRFGCGLENSIGMFVKSFPIRVGIDENKATIDFLKETKANFFGTLKHNYTKFSGLVKEFPGIADVRYIYQGRLLEGCDKINGVIPTVDIIDTYEPVSNLDLIVCKLEDEYIIWFGYNEVLYTEELINCFADLYQSILKQMITKKRLCEFDLMSNASKSFLNTVNNTNVLHDENETIISFFNKAVKSYPNNIAVSYLDKTITYSELDSITDKLAGYLQSKGITRDDFVSVLIPRNEYMAICAMGTVKAGAGYQPLDPTYPEERLNFMVTDCKSKMLIADRSLAHLINDFKGEILYTDEIASLPNYAELKTDAKPSDAFIMIYTSGTTGLPKGCILENKNMVALCYAHIKNFEISENSRVATIASFGFDAGAMDIFTTLMLGAGLYIIPDEIKFDIPELEKFYIENKITNGFMTTQLGRMFAEQTKCQTLKHFLFGGEKLVPFTPPSHVKCGNYYGPSETLAYVCGYTVKDNSTIQPIGKPNDNTKFYIIDSLGRLLPTGASGELCISGVQVGRGYFERPEKTAEAFVKNPFTDEKDYERMYKTGDIVRFLPDGNLEYIGRRDGQVKIRGFRIELTEIEQIIREFEGITNATVQAYDDPVSGKFVAAFITSDKNIDIDELNAFIGSQKPPYMIPAVTMQIDSIPYNANSKVDKRKLPKPERRFEEITKPENELQDSIFELASSVLGTDTFGIDTDLYIAGLSSIGCIKLCSLLADKFEITVQVKDIKQNNTIRKLECFVSESDKTEIEHEILDDYPLTKTQEGILVECISKPDSTFYNIPLLLKISKKLDLNKLKSAIAETVNAHPYLKTQLHTVENGSVRQMRLDASPFSAKDIEVVLENPSLNDSSKLVTPFKLFDSRLFRIKLFVADEIHLFIEIHHIIADGTSFGILISNIEKAYNGEKLSAESYNSFDIAYDEDIRRSTSSLDDAKKFYDDILSDLDMNSLPEPDRLLSAPKASGSFSMEQRLISVQSAKEYCALHGISLNGLFCSAFGFLLAKYSGLDTSVFNTIYNGRNDSRTAETIGMLVKTFPIACNISKEDSLEIAKNISTMLIDSMANDIYSFSEITKDYGVKNDVMLIYQGDSFEFESFCGESAKEIRLALSESKAPLTVEVSIINGKFKYHSEYDPELFTEKLIKTMLASFDKVLCSFITEEKSEKISLLTDDIARELDEYNNTELEYDASKTVADYFLNSVKAYPDKLCTVYKNKKYTYSTVYDMSSKIANYLISKGISNNDVVSILINRDENMVVTAHGVILSGAAYLGLDPTYPKERINFMIKDSGSKIVIADRSLKELIGEFDGEILYADEITSLPTPSTSLEKRIAEITPENRALVIYSSGTTGTPKGAQLCHKNIVAFYQSYTRDMQVNENSHIATIASFGFDGGAQDVFCSPMAGATLFVIPDDIRLDIDKLEQFYITNKITSGFMTTQLGAMFIGNTKCQTLTRFMVGGEKVIPVIPPSHITFLNGYGPSETMCYVNRFIVQDTSTLQPIGKSSINTKEYIIDKFGNRLPFGACGELCISGAQTGLGYLNRPEKTAEVFVKNPFNNNPPYDRMYKTGDIVRQMPDGNYVFVGRRDGQVKIRGFRVELSEIEDQIRKFDGIENVAVQAFDSPAGGKFLAAYVVSENEIDIEKLNEFIANEKPSYMVPAVTVQLDSIPLTSNGKVDKKKLPKPTQTSSKKGVLPANETEEMLCDIFKEVLGLDTVYADDDFFYIGGSSISAVKVIVKCNNAGFDIVFKNLFSNPTPHQLSEFIRIGRAENIYAPGENEADNFDYSSLFYNKVDYVNEIKYSDIGDVLLTGVTGFLGSHILKELLENTASRVICLVRQKDDISAETRFRMMMTYYFEDWFTDELSKRVTILDGDLENKEILEEAQNLKFDTIINSAANVKHFAAGEELLKDNYVGVENLIVLAEKTKAQLIQISSTSVSGEAVPGVVSDDYLFREDQLNIGQSLENKYVYSKYQAEQIVIDAISKKRIKGKIIRLGNLMARIDDSEFQINAGSNGFLKQFSGYKKLGMFPVGLMDKQIEFSPIDSVAKAVVLLSGTPEKFTVFHAKNCNSIHFGYFINAMISDGLDLSIVDDEIFTSRYQNALKDEKNLSAFSSFIAYLDNATNKDGEKIVMHQIESSTDFTTKALYRLGFAWPLISNTYLEKMVKTLIDLEFFA